MGSFILCHKKKAKEPYYIGRIRKSIGTLEEFCYFLRNHLYLVEEEMFDQRLTDWLEEELELPELAEQLRQLEAQYASFSQKVLAVLSYASLYTSGEMEKIKDALNRFKNLKEVEKKKYQGDSLLKSGELSQAILLYRSILYQERDESVEYGFYGQVYGSLGAAYGRSFLYEEAAKMYQKAYEISRKKEMAKAYLYACKQYQSPKQYQELLLTEEIYQSLDAEIGQELAAIEAESKENIGDVQALKAAYR